MEQQQKPSGAVIINNALRSATNLQDTLFLLQDELGSRDNIIKELTEKIEKLEKKPKKEQ